MVSPGTDQQHLGLGEIGEDAAGQAHGGEGHRHGAGADLGVGTHPFRHREGFLEQALQGTLHRFRLLGVGVGLLDLPQDLRLSQHQGVEPAGDPHQVAHRLLVLVPEMAETTSLASSWWNRCSQLSTCSPCPCSRLQ